MTNYITETQSNAGCQLSLCGKSVVSVRPQFYNQKLELALCQSVIRKILLMVVPLSLQCFHVL